MLTAHQEAIAHFRRPRAPDPKAFPFVLFVSTARRPTAFLSLEAMARSLHRRRKGRPLELVNMTISFFGETSSRMVVAVYALRDGQREEQLGLAWLGGYNRHLLQAALLDAEPQQVAA